MIQWILNKLFHKIDIRVNGEPDAPIYLRRWFIYPRNPKDDKFVPRIYLHRFFTGDNVRDLHDHPWRFSSILLAGGYWEHSYNPAWLKWQAWKKQWVGHIPPSDWTEDQRVNYELFLSLFGPEPPKAVKKWYGPGSFLRRGAAWAHAVELKKDKHGNDIACWSLIRTGIKERSWGFHTDNGWCWWRNYHAGACVCYDNPNEDLTNGRASSAEEVPSLASDSK